MEQFLMAAIREKQISLSSHPPNKPTFVDFNVIHPDTAKFLRELAPLAEHFEHVVPGARVAITPGSVTHLRVSGNSRGASRLISRLIREAGGELSRK